MNILYYFWISITETLLRFIPFPSATGLRKIGQPDRSSPVLVTGNFRLTVLRVLFAVRGLDCYLLVANSRGINVWCAASGGHFSYHDVVSAVKTSGIDELVDHRFLILPQLAAVGVEARKIKDRIGWIVKWGPVEAADLPVYLGQKRKTVAMRKVRFPLVDRFEMAIAWAFPMSILGSLISQLFWPRALAGILLLIWGMALGIFAVFPWVEKWQSKPHLGSLRFYGLALAIWILTTAGIVGVIGLDWQSLWPWSLAALFVTLTICADLAGSTPTLKSGTHAEHGFTVRLDQEACIGCQVCTQVCPRNVFEMQTDTHKVDLLRALDCVRCGACIVQCAADALWFENNSGQIVTADAVRRYKLNLMGKRAVLEKQE